MHRKLQNCLEYSKMLEKLFTTESPKISVNSNDTKTTYKSCGQKPTGFQRIVENWNVQTNNEFLRVQPEKFDARTC